MQFEEALEAWATWAHTTDGTAPRTIAEYSYRLRRLSTLPLLAEPAVARAALQTWREQLQLQLQRQDLSPSGAKLYIAALRSFYHGLTKLGLYPENIAQALAGVNVKRTVPRPLSREELHKLYSATDTLLERTLVALYFGAGLRNTEGASLTLGNVRYESREDAMVVRVMGKGQKERVVPLAPDAGAQLARWLLSTVWPENAARLDALVRTPDIDEDTVAVRAFDVAHQTLPVPETRPVFPNRQGKPFTRRQVNRLFVALRHRAGVSDSVVPHRLRHSFATELLDTDSDLRTVQELLGHADIRQTAGYTDVLVSKKARATRALRLPIR